MSNKAIQYDPDQDFDDDEDIPLPDYTSQCPERVYFQIVGEGSVSYDETIDWDNVTSQCEDKLGEQDVSYVREDIHEKTAEILKLAIKMLREIANGLPVREEEILELVNEGEQADG